MAHRLAQESDTDSREASDKELDDGRGKPLLNRREYVKLGATAAALLGIGSLGSASAADSGGTTYRTDFSEGTL